MPLQKEIDRLMQDWEAKAPTEVLDRYTAMKGRIEESSKGSAVPARVPDFVLLNQHGQPVRLAALLARGPVVLNFYRGGWCPLCNLELQALQRMLTERHAELERLGATLLAVAPEDETHARETARRNGVAFDVLSDPGNAVARSFGLVYTVAEEDRPLHAELGGRLPEFNGDASWSLPHPATLVIGRDGRIVWSFVNPDYTRRAEPDEVLAILETLV